MRAMRNPVSRPKHQNKTSKGNITEKAQGVLPMFVRGGLGRKWASLLGSVKTPSQKEILGTIAILFTSPCSERGDPRRRKARLVGLTGCVFYVRLARKEELTIVWCRWHLGLGGDSNKKIEGFFGLLSLNLRSRRRVGKSDYRRLRRREAPEGGFA